MKILIWIHIIYINIFVIMHADIYKPNKIQPHKHVIIFFDLDKVVLNEISGLGKVWAALQAVPLRKSIPILLRQRKRLTKLVKEARYDGQKLKGLKANLDVIIEAEPSLKPYREKLIRKLNGVTPRPQMICFLNSIRLVVGPLAIATNNDYESLCIKIKNLNKKLYKKHLNAFTYDACFCGGACPELVGNTAPYGIPADFVYGGKDTDEYFKNFFNFVEIEFGYNKYETLFIYIDDLDKNIERARRVAAEEKVPLCTVHRNKPDKEVITEMRAFFREYAIF